MLTLKELRGMVTVTKNEGRVPTVKQLQELEDTLVVKKKIDSETEISVYKNGFVLTPSFSRDTESYDLIVDTSVSSITVQATGADSKAAISGAGTISLNGDSVDVVITVQAENGSVRTYTIHVAKQSGGPTAGSQTTGTGSSSPSSGSSGTESGGPGVSGPGSSGSTSNTPGGSNVTIVTVTN